MLSLQNYSANLFFIRQSFIVHYLSERSFYESCYDLVEIVVENQARTFLCMAEGKRGRERKSFREKNKNLKQNWNATWTRTILESDACSSETSRNFESAEISTTSDVCGRLWIYLPGARVIPVRVFFYDQSVLWIFYSFDIYILKYLVLGRIFKLK